MVKKALLPIIFLMLALPGCTGSGTPESVTETAETIPITGPVANPAECANSAAFVNDMTIPDGTIVKASEPFLKVWRLENTGTCPWAEMYTLVFVRGDQMSAPDSVPLRVTQPGETLDLAIDMIAPEIEGEYRADFELRDPAGNAIPVDNGTVLWVIITVETGTSDAGE
jgi:hypothetical protein